MKNIFTYNNLIILIKLNLNFKKNLFIVNQINQLISQKKIFVFCDRKNFHQ